MKLSFKAIGDAPLDIIDGDRGKNYPKQSDFAPSGHCLFLDARNVTSEGLAFADCHFISEQKDDALRKGKLRRHDVVMTTRGTLGNVGFYGQSIPFDNMRINSGMIIFRPDVTRLLPRFLYQYIRSPGYQDQIRSIRSGVAQPQLPIRDIKRMKIPVPPVPTQRRIADILSAYDDAIENNRRRIKLLEDAARHLYEEWFVRLRFPGHEHVRIKDGVPEGWEITELSRVATVNEMVLSASHEGDIDYIDIASVTPGSIDKTTLYDFREAPGRARRVVRHGDIIWSCVRPNRRSHAVIWRPAQNLVASTGFAVITPTELPTSYLYHAVTTHAFVGNLENRAKGVAYPAVVASDFESSPVIKPSHTLVAEFDDFVRQTLDLVHVLRVENKKLASARDVLLPKLMSGEMAA